MECNFCKDKVSAFDKPRKAHLILHKDGEDHVHIHGDLEKKDDVKDMLDAAGEEVGLAIVGKTQKLNFTEVIFHNKQKIGDMLMFTCGIRDFKAAFPDVRVNVMATAPHIWDHNPNIDRSLKEFYSEDLLARAKAAGKKPLDFLTTADFPLHTNVVKIGPGYLTNKSNSLDWHFANAYRLSIEQALNIRIPQGESRPDIYLTEEEYNAPRLFENPYWIICVNGEKGWGCKMYPFVKWQEFVNQNPDITFVQIGTKEDHPPRLQGPNCIDYVGRTQDKNTGIRDLYKLFLNAEGSIGLVSFHMHLSGGLGKPAIIVAGAREPVHFTRFPGHAYLATDGMLPCAVKACWHCGIETCTNPVIRKDQHNQDEIVPKCNDMIQPEDLTRALQGFYIGGRLTKGTPSVKPKFKNVVKTPPKVIPPPPEPEANTYGLPWGSGAILKEDWDFIRQIIKQHNVKNVLEFGAGLSTLLLNAEVRNPGVQGWVTTLETMQTWIDRMKVPQFNPYADIRLWDGRDFKFDKKFDLAFVDGPSGPENRGDAMRIAAECADIVIVHDGNTPIEKEHMQKYIGGQGFEMPGKGGRRCYLWVKKNIVKTPGNVPTIDLPLEMEEESFKKAIVQPAINPQGKQAIVEAPSKKFIKIVSTARGWGGCARSVTTIMDFLLKLGHKVEFIPFRNSVGSREFRTMLDGTLRNVIVTENYETVKEQADVLLMYADDYVWEFEKDEICDVFSNIGADRKVMMLNYRRGKIGEIPWTRGWDKYMFLNSTQEAELLKFLPGVNTKVLPPCTDLTPFINITPDYNHSLRICRHSSQGNTKFDKDSFIDQIAKIIVGRVDVSIDMLPGPDYPELKGLINRHTRTADPQVIANFLGKGNLFWYSLPQGYMDMGPRVILEAMAAGLPVIADNWGGAIDRVTPETGWLCKTKQEHVDIIKGLTVAELKKKGEAAKARARSEFLPERWIYEICGQ